MKTPNTVTLIYTDDMAKRFNPETGDYESSAELVMRQVPCLFNHISQATQFELYGTRQDKVAIVRFAQEEEPFKRLVYNDEIYQPIEQIDAPIKGAVRVKRVIE